MPAIRPSRSRPATEVALSHYRLDPDGTFVHYMPTSTTPTSVANSHRSATDDPPDSPYASSPLFDTLSSSSSLATTPSPPSTSTSLPSLQSAFPDPLPLEECSNWNCFIRFRMTHIRYRTIPAEVESNLGRVSSILGRCWQALSEEQKAPFRSGIGSGKVTERKRSTAAPIENARSDAIAQLIVDCGHAGSSLAGWASAFELDHTTWNRKSLDEKEQIIAVAHRVLPRPILTATSSDPEPEPAQLVQHPPLPPKTVGKKKGKAKRECKKRSHLNKPFSRPSAPVSKPINEASQGVVGLGCPLATPSHSPQTFIQHGQPLYWPINQQQPDQQQTAPRTPTAFIPQPTGTFNIPHTPYVGPHTSPAIFDTIPTPPHAFHGHIYPNNLGLVPAQASNSPHVGPFIDNSGLPQPVVLAPNYVSPLHPISSFSIPASSMPDGTWNPVNNVGAFGISDVMALYAALMSYGILNAGSGAVASSSDGVQGDNFGQLPSQVATLDFSSVGNAGPSNLSSNVLDRQPSSTLVDPSSPTPLSPASATRAGDVTNNASAIGSNVDSETPPQDDTITFDMGDFELDPNTSIAQLEDMLERSIMNSNSWLS